MTRGNASSPTAPKHGAKKTAPVPTLPPLKSRPRLLLVLCILFALWVAGLLTMYFRTVYPYRHDPTRNAPETDK